MLRIAKNDETARSRWAPILPVAVVFSALVLLSCGKADDSKKDSLVAPDVFGPRHAIIGGSLIQNQMDPVARRIVGISEDGLPTCTGILVGLDLVVTAAHCIEFAKNYTITFGYDSNRPEKILPVTAKRVKKNYRTTLDIGLARFEGQIPRWAIPSNVLLDFKKLKRGTKVMLAGYGRPNASFPSDWVLRWTSIIIEDPIFNGQKEILMNQTRGKGACRGDSGGPAFAVVNRELYLFGVTSRGEQDPEMRCDAYGVYTSLYSSWQWLMSAAREISQTRFEGHRFFGQVRID